MADSSILSRVKTALRRSDDTFDEEIGDLIAAALLDLGIAGVTDPDADPPESRSVSNLDTDNPLIRRAVITYCKAHFGDAEPQEYDRLKAAYDEQKGMLSMSTGYTDWGGSG